MSDYTPPNGNAVILDFTEAASPPAGNSVQLEFSPSSEAGLYPSGIPAGGIGTPTVSQPRAVMPDGWPSLLAGNPKVELKKRYLSPSGIIAPALLTTNVVWNYRKYLTPGGIASEKYGTAFVLGGVKYVLPGGIAAPGVGTPEFYKQLWPSGFSSLAMGSPQVSPRIIRPSGFSGVVGTPWVQRNPNPIGFFTQAMGYPSIDYKTKTVWPTGIASFDTGYPRVFDPTQKILLGEWTYTTVFGDTLVINKTRKVSPAGYDFSEFSPWAEVASNRRYVYQSGLDSAAFGATTVANKTPQLFAQGFSALSSPSGVGIGYRVRYVVPPGINQSAFGTAIVTKTPAIGVIGFAGDTGTPTVWYRVRTIETIGSAADKHGDAFVAFRYRQFYLDGFASEQHGSPRIEYSRRTLLQSGAPMGGIGLPAIDNRNRTLRPSGIFFDFPSAHMVGGTRYLRPSGFIATRFGSRIIPEIQTVYPLGFSGRWSDATVANYRQVIRPPGFLTIGTEPAQRWGQAKLHNLRQYIIQTFDINSGLVPPTGSIWTKIENRSRTMRATGNQMTLFGYTGVDNKARPLRPTGISYPSMPDYYRAGMVAYRVRSLPLEGIEPPYISGWSVIYNDARLLGPTGFNAAAFGGAAFANTRRYFRNIGAFDAAIHGTPMVDFRIRSLGFEGRFTIAPPVIPQPGVKLHTRYVDGIGYEASAYGVPALSIHWTIITPRWTHRNFFGEPAVWNKTPELRTRGRASDEYGDTLVRLQWRPVAPFGNGMQLFGKAEIAYRNRRVTVTGLNTGSISALNTVTRLGSGPYSTQNITLTPLTGDNGDGIPAPVDQVGRPTINQQEAYPEGIAAAKYGRPSVTANTIRVEPGYQELTVGSPTVSLKVRTIKVKPWEDLQVPQPSKPRLSPLTIWAVMEAPTQAIDNHPLQDLHYVDGYGRAPGAIFGDPIVTLKNRRITVHWDDGNPLTKYGTATVTNVRQYIQPDGIRSLRLGWHMLPSDQVTEQFDSADCLHMGSPAIGRPAYAGLQAVYPPGTATTAFGDQDIQPFNRTIYPSGINALAMGNSGNSDTPYMWQRLHVGPPMPVMPTGTEMSKFGTQWISLRVRGIEPEGFESFLCEYQLEAFDKRMHVRKQPLPRPTPLEIAPVGFYAFTSAASDVRLGVRYIRPDGNSDQYRKGAPNA